MEDTVTIPIAERLDERAVRAMTAALAAAGDARVIVIEGVPERFCLGLDFESASGDLGLLASLLLALMRAPRPTLAIVDGPALGGGLGLAAACDLVIATERATFGLPEALYGLAPAIIRPALLGRLSPQKLRALLFSCHSRTAQEAKELGLVDEVIPVETLAAARRRAARQLRRANGATVRACRRWEEATLERRLQAGVEETARALRDPEVREALRAFTVEEALPWMR